MPCSYIDWLASSKRHKAVLSSAILSIYIHFSMCVFIFSHWPSALCSGARTRTCTRKRTRKYTGTRESTRTHTSTRERTRKRTHTRKPIKTHAQIHTHTHTATDREVNWKHQNCKKSLHLIMSGSVIAVATTLLSVFRGASYLLEQLNIFISKFNKNKFIEFVQ